MHYIVSYHNELLKTKTRKHPRQCCFPIQRNSESVGNTYNLARLGKKWIVDFNFFQARKIDSWNKTKTALEIIGIEIFTRELEEIKTSIVNKLFVEIKWTEKIIDLSFYSKSMILHVKSIRCNIHLESPLKYLIRFPVKQKKRYTPASFTNG